MDAEITSWCMQIIRIVDWLEVLTVAVTAIGICLAGLLLSHELRRRRYIGKGSGSGLADSPMTAGNLPVETAL